MNMQLGRLSEAERAAGLLAGSADDFSRGVSHSAFRGTAASRTASATIFTVQRSHYDAADDGERHSDSGSHFRSIAVS